MRTLTIKPSLDNKNTPAVGVFHHASIAKKQPKVNAKLRVAASRER